MQILLIKIQETQIYVCIFCDMFFCVDKNLIYFLRNQLFLLEWKKHDKMM